MLILTRRTNETFVIGERWEITLLKVKENKMTIRILQVELDEVHTKEVELTEEPFQISPKIQLSWKKGRGQQYQFLIQAPSYISFYRKEINLTKTA